jgi:hypothetical protein
LYLGFIAGVKAPAGFFLGLIFKERRCMKLLIQTTQRLCMLLPLISMIVTSCSSTPLNNVFDTQPIYTVLGADKYYKERNKCEGRWYISPIYQQTSTVRNDCGKKVAAGDRLGQWNMFGIFFGSDAIPTGETIAADYPNIRDARTAVSSITGAAQGANFSRYRGGIMAGPGVDLTLETNFDPYKYTFAYYSSPAYYEKAGIRTQFNFDMRCGFGLSARGGVVDVKFKPRQIILEKTFQDDINATTEATEQTTDAKKLYAALFSDDKLRAIGNELNLPLATTPPVYRHTDAEDIHLQAYWHIPVELKDDAGDLAATVIPYVAFGSWFPTGKKINPNNPFSVPTGNDGFYILTFEASIGIDFPLLPESNSTLQFCIGGGATTPLDSKTRNGIRIPSTGRSDANPHIPPSPATDFQSGVIPWSTTIRQQPGTTWYFNASLKAGQFLGGLSFYGDYIYTQHLKDSISLREPDATRLASFNGGLARYKRQTAWKNQQFNFGLDYQVAKALSIGGAVQSHISGERVFTSTTLLGSLTFIF